MLWIIYKTNEYNFFIFRILWVVLIWFLFYSFSISIVKWKVFGLMKMDFLIFNFVNVYNLVLFIGWMFCLLLVRLLFLRIEFWKLISFVINLGCMVNGSDIKCE